jgi:hypothetical protein
MAFETLARKRSLLFAVRRGDGNSPLTSTALRQHTQLFNAIMETYNTYSLVKPSGEMFLVLIFNLYFVVHWSWAEKVGKKDRHRANGRERFGVIL